MTHDKAGMTTVSRVLMGGNTCEPERELLRKWAEHAASHGGSFSVRNEWTESSWYTTWTINWPPAAADPINAGHTSKT